MTPKERGEAVEEKVELSSKPDEAAGGRDGEEGSAVEDEARRLKEELDAMGRELDEMKNLYLRSCAELENYRKRVEKEKASHLLYANERLVKELLPVIDNLDRALAHSESEIDPAKGLESLRNGLRLTVKELEKVLDRFGLKAVKAVGERFDPTIHEAISHEESADNEAGTVIKEFQKGYMLNDRLVRPAIVAVAKEPRGDDEDS
ncbi:MAG TPA: nucleotide exchange factor GrpE [Deltaproteobacteria bacterium]|nr:nucleotide exchange factor GrpE [Deltaproteobacteria bacterium]